MFVVLHVVNVVDSMKILVMEVQPMAPPLLPLVMSWNTQSSTATLVPLGEYRSEFPVLVSLLILVSAVAPVPNASEN